MKTIHVPTGEIMIKNFSKGPLEFLSIGDYGQASNIKADFLGLNDEIHGVPNGDVMPLSEKWVITISTQYGCSMSCKFCDVPMVGRGRNASFSDMVGQIILARMQHPEIKKTKRLNIHFARMGEPSFNLDVIDVFKWLATDAQKILGLECGTLHPVFTTMMPKKNKLLEMMLDEVIYYKNEIFNGEAGLQLSINSTSNIQRNDMLNGCAMSLEDISLMVRHMVAPVGRKYTLNFALADGYKTDGAKLASLFNPDHWMVKLTPIHETHSTDKNNITTTGGYNTYVAYSSAEKAFKDAGFDVLVFIPSLDEDQGMITCGNAVLSGKAPTNQRRKNND